MPQGTGLTRASPGKRESPAPGKAKERGTLDDEPKNPIELLEDARFKDLVLSRDSKYIAERRFLHLPDEAPEFGREAGDFRAAIPCTPHQGLVFENFKTGYVAIPASVSGQFLHAFIIIPNDVLSGESKGPYPVHVRFHGGGFCTGSPDYKPWFALHIRNLMLQQHCITLMPEYRKMPESAGVDILEDIDTFWKWYQGPTFDSDLLVELSFLKGRQEVVENMEKNHLLVSGESAGGFLAAYSWISQPKLRMNALYLQYPMLKQYTRNPGNPYRGVEIGEKEAQTYAACYCKHILELKDKGLITPRTSSSPPQGMDMAYMLSSTRMDVLIDGAPAQISYWQWWFNQLDMLERLQEIVGRGPNETGRERVTPIPLGAVPSAKPSPDPSFRGTAPSQKLVYAVSPANHAKPAYCPAIFISHGTRDANCPIEDTMAFLKSVRVLFPSAKLRPQSVPDQEHAFDYILDENTTENGWLKSMLDDIGLEWRRDRTTAVDSSR